ncbi:hypothetical protein [Sporisorium scitamineum]|uniref:Uncharacterized protein n=1 Tax=Sporisorium scitamineum TaxID=49012 RepID=A0A0F7SE25_9BASI|nr:hypothetical protein [Sporisorium scitamineum]
MPPKKRSARPAAAASPDAVDGSTASSPLQDAMAVMTSLFPITIPFPDPATDDTLIPPADVMLEQELLCNPDNFRSWASYIDHIIDTNIVKRPPPDVSLSTYQASLLGPLASSTQRIALRRITSIYERALAQFPTRYSLWRDYLQNRSRFVLGEPKGGFEAKRKRDLQAAREKLDFGPTLIDSTDDEDFGASYKGGLDGTLGWQEWKSLAAVARPPFRTLTHDAPLIARYAPCLDLCISEYGRSISNGQSIEVERRASGYGDATFESTPR